MYKDRLITPVEVILGSGLTIYGFVNLGLGITNADATKIIESMLPAGIGLGMLRDMSKRNALQNSSSKERVENKIDIE